MIRRFLHWLEDAAYGAVFRGCSRAVKDLSGGEVVLEIESSPVVEERRERLEDRTSPKKKSTTKR